MGKLPTVRHGDTLNSRRAACPFEMPIQSIEYKVVKFAIAVSNVREMPGIFEDVQDSFRCRCRVNIVDGDR
ncbi:hypothetical protein TNCV_2067771 [Trichonephila clavipes]|uniref:Uncharacterized protein n=1 Tax=Trichonephila clavipes TaxID=2585209 RepID=A0A8X6W3F4_TRICX|nr:hypothetical protein TNCV_2067771 [Trichonephila clavipes]